MDKLVLIVLGIVGMYWGWGGPTVPSRDASEAAVADDTDAPVNTSPGNTGDNTN